MAFTSRYIENKLRSIIKYFRYWRGAEIYISKIHLTIIIINNVLQTYLSEDRKRFLRKKKEYKTIVFYSFSRALKLIC